LLVAYEVQRWRIFCFVFMYIFTNFLLSIHVCFYGHVYIYNVICVTQITVFIKKSEVCIVVEGNKMFFGWSATLIKIEIRYLQSRYLLCHSPTMSAIRDESRLQISDFLLSSALRVAQEGYFDYSCTFYLLNIA
jgi:hypothetical protein